MAEVILKDSELWEPEEQRRSWKLLHIKEEGDELPIKQEPEDFPLHIIIVNTEGNEEKSKLQLSGTEENGQEPDEEEPEEVQQEDVQTDDSSDSGRPQAQEQRSSVMVCSDSYVTDPGPFSCSECGKSFRWRSYYQKHKLIHTGERPYDCSECMKKFRYKSCLQRHVSLVHFGERLYKCSVCQKTFKEKTTLTRHLRHHHHFCSICKKLCQNKKDLIEHLKCHVEDGTLDESSFVFRETIQPFGCAECGKSFRWKSLLQTHMKVHSTQSQGTFSCPECGKIILTQKNISRHMRTHSGQRRFTCSVCGQGFIKNMALKQHQTLSHHLCPVCPQQLQDQVQLSCHLKVHIQDGTLDPRSLGAMHKV